MSIFVIITIAAFVFAGLILLVLGLRGRIADDHPYCRRCRFDLHERWPDVAICPECGSKLGEGTIRVGRRVRGRGKIITALLMFALVGAFAGTMFTSAYQSLAPYKPQWLLRLDMDYGSRELADAAVTELAGRMGRGELSPAAIESLVAGLLDIQQNLALPWQPAYGDLIETARCDGHLGDALWQRYVEQGLQIPILTRGIVRRNSPVAIRFELAPVRYGSGFGYPVRITQPVVVQPGESASPDQHGWFGTTVQTGDAPGSSLTTRFRQTLPIGAHVVELAMEFAVEFNGIETTFTRRERVDLAVRPGDDAFVLMNDLEHWEGSVRHGLQAKHFTVDRVASPYISGTIEIANLPVDVAFETTLIDGDRRWKLPYGHVTGRAGRPSSVSVHSTLADLKGEEPFDARRVDVLLEPSAEAAEGTVDIMSIWGKPVLIEDVTVTWSIDLPNDPGGADTDDR